MFKKLKLTDVVIVPREEYDRLKRDDEMLAMREMYASQIAAAKRADATAPRVERPFVEPAPGAFLSAEEDRELVAMGREIWSEWPGDWTIPAGAIWFRVSDQDFFISDGEEKETHQVFAPTPDNPEHLTDAARALLRRVRDERKSTTPKEGTDNDAS